MKRKVDPIMIGCVSRYMAEKAECLEQLKIDLKDDINRISNVYQGADSEKIQEVYLEKVGRIENIIQNLKYFSKYFTYISEDYGEILDKSKRKFDSILDEMERKK